MIVTSTELLADPSASLQVKVNWLSAVSPSIVSVPDRSLLPDQSPEAVQLSALTLSQVSVVEPSVGTLVGSAVRVTDNAVVSTVTLTLSSAVPPEPLQESV